MKTRRSSSSATCRASHAKTGGRSQASQSISARRPVGHDAREVPEDAAARHVREPADVVALAQSPHVVEVEPRGREEVVARVVLGLEHAPHEREAVRVHAGRREADDRVALLDPRAVDQPARARRARRTCRRSRARPRGRSREAPPSRLRRARNPPRGTPRQRPRRAPRPSRGRCGSRRRSRGRTADRRREVSDVVDAVRGEVGAARPQRAALAARGSASSRPSRSTRRGAARRPADRARRTRRSPSAPVDSTAARSRSTTASAFAIETPAASYVCSAAHGPSVQSTAWTSRPC